MTSFLSLIDRVENRKGSDRELEADIAQAVGYQRSVPRFLQSLDEARSLVPVGYGWMVRFPFNGPPAAAYVVSPDNEHFPANAPTPARALCSAALRARLKNGGGG